MTKKITFYLKKSKLFLMMIGFFSIFLLTSACHWDQDEDKIADNKVLLLKFSDDTNDFIEGKEYKSFNKTHEFTLNVTKENHANEIITNVTYAQTNALLLKASTLPLPAKGQIIIPEDFSAADTFARVETNDFVSPKNGYKELESYILDESYFIDMWSKIQSLVKVREYLNSNPEQQIQIFFHQHSIENNTKGNWIFILKN